MFMVNAGFDMTRSAGAAAAESEPPTDQPSVRPAAVLRHRCATHVLLRPDIEALKASSTRVVVGIGADSGQLLTYRTSMALASCSAAHRSNSPATTVDSSGAPSNSPTACARCSA